MNHTALVYQAYGPEAVFRECLWSLISLARWVPPEEAPPILIYTDNPQWFVDRGISFPITFCPLDAATIKAWRGPHDFVHRLKIELLLDARKRYKGPLLYLDTDTEFIQSPMPLLQRVAAGDLFMHVSEGRLSRPQQPVLNKLLKAFESRKIGAGLGITVTEATEMWNAGVLGFSGQADNILQRTLELTDALYPQYPKHIVEQFAFSVAFSEAGNVHSAAPWIFHYWNFKEWRLWLASFFDYFRNAAWCELVRQSSRMPIHVPLQEKMGFYQGRSLWGKITKEKWQPSLPDWEDQS